jgi:hypothetical protein
LIVEASFVAGQVPDGNECSPNAQDTVGKSKELCFTFYEKRKKEADNTDVVE